LPSALARLNNLANLYRATGRYAEAEPLFQRAIAIGEKSLPPHHPYQALCRENYARFLDRLGRTNEAAALRNQAEASRQQGERD
jgi:tetratricopeptide (TPR) repeat protein